MTEYRLVRVSNAIQDPVSKTSVAQDQVVRVTGEDGDWFKIETLEGVSGRIPRVLALPITEPTRSPGQSLYCSTDAYTSVRADDLPFTPFTLFLAAPSKYHEGWLEGYSLNDYGMQLGPKGLLPEGYMVKLTEDAPAAVEEHRGMTSSFTTNFNEVQMRQQPQANSYSVAPYARANFDFQGEFSNELSFSVDEMITLRRRVDADWLEGSIGERIGIFPSSFVQIIVDLPEDNTSNSGTLKNNRKSTTDEGIGFATVRHPFTGREEDELTVAAGDTVRVLRMVNDEWVMCRDPDTDRNGIVPVGFLEVYLDEEDEDVLKSSAAKMSFSTPANTSVSTLNNDNFNAPTTLPDWRTSTRIGDAADWNSSPAGATPQQWATFGEDWIAPDATPRSAAPARPPPPKQSSVQSPNDVVSVTEMFGMMERQAPPRPNAPLTMFATSNDLQLAGLDSTATQEEKRAKILEELINSELQFITDINCYTEVVDSSTLLSGKQKIIMKNGCAQIVQLSATLVQLLTNEQLKPTDKQAIGNCFLQLRKPFAQTYGFYFRNIEHINQLLTSAKTERTMEEALNDVVQRMRLAGAGVIDSTTAVGRPVQRCLKYPLFLSEILKHTPVNHYDHPKLMEAVKQMSNLGQKMNESKRRKELTRKYTEEEGPQSFGDMLSKLTIHSLVKKSNRFTYRMGSSLGVVKLTRDSEFDRLVCELDTAERRLVRFNYMLVIYRKKMFHETRVILYKRIIEPRKKQVSASDADHQLYVFNDAIKDFAATINAKVRDDVVQALRSLPKKLIKKRNDKLMDYEAAKSKDKNSQMRAEAREKYNDYEALNTQVKQQLPKAIDNLNRVLQEAMKTVTSEDEKLMAKLRTLFEEQKALAAADPNAHSRKVILADSVCFVNYYDHDRLKPLGKIANKASHSLRMRARSASPERSRKEKKNGSEKRASEKPKKKVTVDLNATLQEQWSKGAVVPESFHPPTTSASVETPTKFRAQTAEERVTILEKAKSKGRLNDMYVVLSPYPADQAMMNLAVTAGKLLIVQKDDLVLAVNKEVPSMWLCYNGFYNAILPSNVLRPYKQQQTIEQGVDVARLMSSNMGNLNNLNNVNTRPHSTPPKSQNLIDLDDLLGGGPPISLAPLTPQPVAPFQLSPLPLQPTAANSSSAASALSSTAFANPWPSPNPEAAPQNSNSAANGGSIFDGVKSIDWGMPSAIRTPSMPNLTAAATLGQMQPVDWGQPSFAPAEPSLKFPVMFDESPGDKSSFSSATLPTYQNAPTSLNQRSDSPQPLIPSRPTPSVKSSLPMTSGPPPSQAPPPMRQTFNALPPMASYDAVPGNGSMLYAMPPMYDVTPSLNTSTNMSNNSFGKDSRVYPSLYDIPPASMGQYAQPPLSQYDAPPLEPTTPAKALRPVLGEVRVDYDFVPQGTNQMAVKEGEILGVVQRTDDDGNPEWLLLQRPDAKCGYVPSAYCRSL
ncbi:unnamed protein product [Caenorhabditis auriculariae]|uniref:SH3 domain-containing GRB2-like protein n=1 Tax=Caenorhabditis auriculariae TaxID=2777116 RepID=A0A8S1HG42_9PELO|nr:unnamed protein product [Caenorhabditis auriculariae]